MLFKQIIGHTAIKNRLLRSSLNSRVSHALLLHGPEGNGKFALAMAFAQFLNCTGIKSEDSCGVCPSCQKAAKLIHPDIHYIFPVATSKKVTSDPVSDRYIAEWREYIADLPYPSLQGWMNYLDIENKQGGIFKKEAEELLRKLSLKAFESEYKVVIIWLPEKMNPTTANKLLKVIEEPPEKTVFLLLAEQTEKILPTILSRTQLIIVPKLSDEDLVEGLEERYPELAEKLPEIVPLAEGNYLRAVNLLNTNEQIQFYQEHFIKWMRMCFRYRVNDIINWIPAIASMGRERQKAFLQYGLHLIRENYLLNQNLESVTRMTPTEREFSSRFFAFIHPGNIEALFSSISKAIQHIEMNANPRILFLDLSMEMYKALKIKAS
ncbi:MAG: DNA polymerase III subunit [Bacteroidota bacterium]|nr:DNA polymerase III subunit [Bacteroidota bacterium]